MVTDAYPAPGVNSASHSRLNGHAGDFEEMDTTSTSCIPSRSKSNPPSPDDPALDEFANEIPLPLGSSNVGSVLPPHSNGVASDHSGSNRSSPGNFGSNCSSPINIPGRTPPDCSPLPWLNASDSNPIPVKQSCPVDIPKRKNGKGRNGGVPPLTAAAGSGSAAGPVGGRKKGKRKGRKN